MARSARPPTPSNVMSVLVHCVRTCALWILFAFCLHYRRTHTKLRLRMFAVSTLSHRSSLGHVTHLTHVVCVDTCGVCVHTWWCAHFSPGSASKAWAPKVDLVRAKTVNK